jgi:antitoxin PrlF
MQSAITSKGQATIPKAIREHLHLKSGDKVKFFVDVKGSVFLLPVVPASTLRGMLKPHRKGVTLEEMDRGIASAAVSRFKRGAAKARR